MFTSLYSIRSERAFCQDLDYNLLYRWFLDMDLMEPSFDATASTNNRRKLLRHKAGRKLFEEEVYEADRRGLMSDERFSVDRTLIEAAASIKGFRRRDDDDESGGDGDGETGAVRGENLFNATHRSATAPDARLMRIPGSRRLSVGADRGYDTKAFVTERRDLNVTPHVAQRKR